MITRSQSKKNVVRQSSRLKKTKKQRQIVKAAPNYKTKITITRGKKYIVDNNYKNRRVEEVTDEIEKIEKDLEKSHHGMEFDGTNPKIKQLFEPHLINNNVVDSNYVYVISKKIDSRTFIKIGESSGVKNSDVRLRNAQTFLLPGLKNIGFKVHFIFFYESATGKYNDKKFAYLVEQELHEYVREKFEGYKLYFPSSYVSEWYLPNDDYLDFFNKLYGIVSVLNPKPIDIVEFTREAIIHRDVEKNTEDLKYYSKDLTEIKNKIYIQKIENDKQKVNTKGSKEYWLSKLIDKSISFKIDGVNYYPADIVYYASREPLYKQTSTYYVDFKWVTKERLTRASIKPPELDFKILPHIQNVDASGMLLSYSAWIGDILEVLNKKKMLEDGELGDLKENYEWYKDKKEHIKNKLRYREIAPRVRVARKRGKIADYQYLINTTFKDKDYKESIFKIKKVDINKDDNIVAYVEDMNNPQDGEITYHIDAVLKLTKIELKKKNTKRRLKIKKGKKSKKREVLTNPLKYEYIRKTNMRVEKLRTIDEVRAAEVLGTRLGSI